MTQFRPFLIETGLYGLTIKGALDTILKFDNKTLIFFDTETMGLSPEPEEIQLTEVASIAFDGTTFKEIGRFHYKIKLAEKTQQFIKSTPPVPGMKTPSDLLKMTRYGEHHGKYLAEKDVLQKFSDFLNQYPSPILIAHNATFDMRFIMVRGKRLGVKFKPIKVIDTVKIANYFFVPILRTIQDNPMLDRLRKDNGMVSVSLGKLAPALEVNIKDWHSAFADVSTMIEALKKMIEFLKAHKDIDIRTAQKHAIKHDQWMSRYYRPKKK